MAPPDYPDLQDRLEVHFADEDDDAAALAALRRELEGNAALSRAVKGQLDAALRDRGLDPLEFVRRHANRHCDFSPDEARRWLERLRAALPA